jgi:hypothetical protein
VDSHGRVNLPSQAAEVFFPLHHPEPKQAMSQHVVLAGMPFRLLNTGKMMLLWAFFGTCIGAGCGPSDAGMVGIIAGMIAGVIIMPWLGLVLGLLGAEVRCTLIGGVQGTIVGLLAGVACGVTPIAYVVHSGLIGGALAGGTVPFVLGQFQRTGRLMFGLLGLFLYALSGTVSRRAVRTETIRS